MLMYMIQNHVVNVVLASNKGSLKPQLHKKAKP